MLKLCPDARLPLVAVHTSDVLNFFDVIKELVNRVPQYMPNKGPYAAKTIYVGVLGPERKFGQSLTEIYDKMATTESTLLLVNPPQVIEPMYDAGEAPAPRPLLMRFLKAVVENEKRAEKLVRGLGGCTIKEAAELCRLTMARDSSLTAAGLMATRKSSFQGSRGLTQVETKQAYYDPHPSLKAWVAKEKAFFLTGADRRLIPRGLLFDGLPGVGKTAGSKWIAEQMGAPLYRMDIGGAKNKYVGQSEANLLNNLSRIDAEEPAVALLDEVEKVFLTKEGDGGTTTSMLSQLLWWLAEHKSRVLTIMTTNSANTLPKELYREGRIDEVMMLQGFDKDEAIGFIGAVLETFRFRPGAAHRRGAQGHWPGHVRHGQAGVAGEPDRGGQKSRQEERQFFVQVT